jgi:DNA-binding Lrp family transcriptional regulator
LLSIEAEKTGKIAERLAGIADVSEVYSVAGNYDLVAVSRLQSNEEPADRVTMQIRGVPGIKKSQTLIAFRAYSRHDLDLLFEMG